MVNSTEKDNLNRKNPKIWTSQFSALSGAISRLKGQIGATPIHEHAPLDEQPRIQEKINKGIIKLVGQSNTNSIKILEALEQFSTAIFEPLNAVGQSEQSEQSEHFQLTLGENFDFDLDPNSIYHPRLVLNSLLKNISVDLNIIQNAYAQRSDGAADISNNPSLRTLLLAELLARRSFESLSNSKAINMFPRNFSVLTYPNHKIEIRILPYCTAALIGIPFAAYAEYSDGKNDVAADSVRLATEFMAIPHEIGHALYRHGKIKDAKYVSKYLEGEVTKKLYDEGTPLSSTIWILDWIEEIFADAYGCLVAGPLSVVGFQSMMSKRSLHGATQKTAKHPIPALRPLVQTQILRELSYLQDSAQNHDDLKLLDEEWQTIALHLWEIEDVRKKHYEINGQNYSGELILFQLQPAIEIMARYLHDWLRAVVTPWPTSAIKSYDLDTLEVTIQPLSTLFDPSGFGAASGIVFDTERIASQLKAAKQGKIDKLKKEIRIFNKHNPNDVRKIEDEIEKINLDVDDIVKAVLLNGWLDVGPNEGHDPD